MSDSNTPVEVVIDDDLDAFSETFYGQKGSEETPASVTEDKGDEPTSDALEPNDTPVEDDADGTVDEDADDKPKAEDDNPEPVEPKLTPTQKRINEVVAKQRAAERALESETAARKALEERIAQLTATKNETAESNSTDAKDSRPDPLAKNEDGTDKYPLGDFDPEYIADLVKYENARDRAIYEQQAAEKAERAKVEAEIAAIENNWNDKLGPAKERYPDFDEVGQTLISNFDDLAPEYGEYLVRTLQSMDHGPDVLYYLAQNPDIADQIVKSGPQKATIALGRIEARFENAPEQREVAKPRVSQAPTPPPQNKGNLAAVVEVPDDTDDLEAFTAKLFKKRK